jgi:hypothetical protein
VVHHGRSRRALWLALEDALAVRSYGWIDFDTPWWEQRASDDEFDLLDDCHDIYGQSAHCLDDVHAYQYLDPCAYMFCWK